MSDSNSIFLGVDVAKQWIDVCALDAAGRRLWRRRVARTAAAVAALGERIGEPALAVLEGTGGLERLPAAALEALGVSVAIQNPQRMRNYALSHGRLEKSDPADAWVLAEYARERRPAPRLPPEPEHEELVRLVARRRQLVRLRSLERTRFRAETCAGAYASLNATIEFLSEQVNQLDRLIGARIDESEKLRRRRELLMSAPGVGATTAAELLASLPELGALSRGQAGKLAGLAPLVKQSGQWNGRAMTLGGRAPARSALYMAALTTVRWNPYFQDCYLRLVARGKQKKVALVAMARRLLTVLNRMLAEDRPFDPTMLPAPPQ